MERFIDVVDEMQIKCGLGVVDHRAKVGDVLNGYAGGRQIMTEDGPVELAASAADQLFRKIGLPIKVINEFGNYPDLQKAMAMAKLEESKNAEQVVLMRGREQNGVLRYDACLTKDYLPVSNAEILRELRDQLPETAMVHRAQIHNRTMMMRIVDDDWYHDLNGDRALTGLIVRNDEIGRSALSFRTGITRVACWNYTLDEQPVWEHTHKFLTPDQVRSGIADAIGRLSEVASAVAERLRSFNDVHVDDVQTMLKVMAGELGLPNYSLDAARQWWEDSGAHETLFWVIQAVAFGAGSMTDGKRQRWEAREEVEYQIMNMGNTFTETGELRVCECPRCHRPMQEYTQDDVLEVEYEVS